MNKRIVEHQKAVTSIARSTTLGGSWALPWPLHGFGGGTRRPRELSNIDNCTMHTVRPMFLRVFDRASSTDQECR